MSIVIKNLEAAIIGESNAKRKYELFAEKAKEENQPEVAHLFEAVSNAEAIHIKNHLRAFQVLSNKDVRIKDFIKVNEEELKKKVADTKSNLLDAIKGETYETKQMYKKFVKNSKNEGNNVAELSFSLARKAEKVHAKIFNIFLKKIEKKEILEKRKIFVCQICGNVEFDEAPSLCPLCDHTEKFFNEI